MSSTTITLASSVWRKSYGADVGTQPAMPSAFNEATAHEKDLHTSRAHLVDALHRRHTVSDAVQGIVAMTHRLALRAVQPSGGLNLRPIGPSYGFCVPADAPRMDLVAAGKQPVNSAALVTVVSEPGTSGLLGIKIAREARVPGYLEALALSLERDVAIRRAKYKRRRACGLLPPNRNIEVPEPLDRPDMTTPEAIAALPPPVLLCVSRGGWILRPVKWVMQVRGHRIRVVERPEAGWFNRQLAWEARLMYPNYPTDDDAAAVLGEHYTLLVSHQDLSGCCCGCCFNGCVSSFGSAGQNGNAIVELALLRSLAIIAAPPPPSSMGSSSSGGPRSVLVQSDADVTGDEVALAMMVLVPLVNWTIVARKTLVYTIPLTLLAALIAALRVYFAIGKH
ncbi:hypothetical protein BC828DRAFT_377754 [Blastocladiella britannica]|nr:hypothetical protein BC828DRAFT_377754 [Blastocladiella britannica]